MDKEQLKSRIDACRQAGRPVAISFCSHVPQEVLEAAGFCALRVLHAEGIEDISENALPKNLCPVVKECYSLCEDGTLEGAELIIAESSCDGKKKMYELLRRQEQLYYYQVPQGEDRAYVDPLIRSEIHWLIRMLRERFGAEVTEEGLRRASEALNAERESVMALMAIQKQTPPAAWGREILEALDESRLAPDPAARTRADLAARERLLSRVSPVPEEAHRVLVTGCPASGVYQKVVGAVERNGGVVVCFENCEVVKSSRRHVDTAAEDMVGAVAECYRDTACAIMSPNDLRFRLIASLLREYRAEAVIDLALQTCHAYTVERDKLRRFCAEKGIPYLPVETDHSDTDTGQIETRICAMLEMLA